MPIARNMARLGSGMLKTAMKLEPPLLLSAKHHEAGQKICHEEAFPEDQAIVMSRIGLGDAEKQQEQAEKQRGVMSKVHDHRKEQDMGDGEKHGYATG